jgi:Mn-dependent DtxR family transcriptional regulator
VTAAIFNSLVDSAQTRWLTKEHRKLREALPSIVKGDAELLAQWASDDNFIKFCQGQEAIRKRGAGGKTKGEIFKALTLEKKLQTYCDSLKKSLPFVIFIATYIETASASGKMGCWRKQAACRLNGLCVIDFDHIEGDPREVWAAAFARLSDEDKARVLFVFVTPSGHGLKVVFIADAAVGNLIDNQKVFSQKLGLNPDEACKDASRGAFLTTREDIILIDEERLFTYENEEFGKKYNEQYHHGKSQPTLDFAEDSSAAGSVAAVQGAGENQPLVSGGDGNDARVAESLTYHNVPYQTIVAAWLGDKKIEQGDRHRTSLVLADHLRYITDNDPKLIEQILRETPFVKEIINERNEDVATTVESAQGYEFLKGIPKRMQQALKAAGAVESSEPQTSDFSPQTSSDDIYASLPLDNWAEELTEMAAYYPCMKELFLNVHPHKLPAVWFSSAALFGTLMTRTWYHFWYEPELVRRLNYCIFIIGDPGAGKNIVEKFYKKIADPMIQSDQCLIDAVNRYKEGRTERTTSTKAQKGEALKRPVVGIRVHPARTATGEFIRHMNAAVENIQGQTINLHMFSFDAELDNVTKQNKGGDWKDREILELKAFHNEQDGQMYANQESVTGMFNVFWNFIYTGTPYALHRKVNQRNFGTGMSTRLAVIPLPDKGMAKRHQQVDPTANETLSTWAYRLDKVEGELPVEPLNDETFEWQTAHMEIAEFNGDKADRTLLKRIPYYGIGISLPFILMRHWDEWQEHRTLTMDDRDKRLCRLAMDIQYRCQQFFFGEMAFNYFADQNKEFVQRRRSGRYEECFRKLPDEFRTQQFMDVFGVSQSAAQRAIARLQQDQLIEKVKYGVYRKVLQEMP